MTDDQTPQTLFCLWCATPFVPPKPTGRRPRYCRRSCRQRAFEARETERRIADALNAANPPDVT